MSRTQYIFIDYENVCESDLSRTIGKPVQVFMIVGNRHKNLPTSLFLFAQDHPNQLRIIQTPMVGRNALDFVLTFELGCMFNTDPEGYYHIISKDTDFDSVISHIKRDKPHIARHTSMAEIPALRTTEEKLARLKQELADPTQSRPSKRQTLQNKIKSTLDRDSDPEFIEKTIQSFEKSGILSFTDKDKIDYHDAA